MANGLRCPNFYYKDPGCQTAVHPPATACGGAPRMSVGPSLSFRHGWSSWSPEAWGRAWLCVRSQCAIVGIIVACVSERSCPPALQSSGWSARGLVGASPPEPAERTPRTGAGAGVGSLRKDTPG
ncbi:hypothetical protein NDU88_001071 [Pleurodeles waltl]|uniref:Uncharacterized protein n=1 Tax=Pleurodeles waltl TaxID=8319 RepID=A0AAV7Q5V6_PLEWA|nr:hypothetical protein NDU88_001071 [Pleurodeles waltl]